MKRATLVILMLFTVSIGLASAQQRRTQSRTNQTTDSQKEFRESPQSEQYPNPTVVAQIEQGEFKTEEEQYASWKGERIMLLPLHPDDKDNKYTLAEYGWCKPSAEPVSYRQYAGRIGLILESSPGHILIQLNGSDERITMCHPFAAIGFFSELDAAKGLVGKTVWSKNNPNLLRNCVSRGSWSPLTDINVGQVAKLTVTRVEWGFAGFSPGSGNPIEAYFRTGAGEEGCPAFDSYTFLRKFYRQVRRGELDQRPLFTRDFYLEDLRKKFNGWSQGIWELIEKGEVAVGMTEEMARIACGGELEKVGVAVSRTSSIGQIYRGTENAAQGCRKQFLVENGKVTKFLD